MCQECYEWRSRELDYFLEESQAVVWNGCPGPDNGVTYLMQLKAGWDTGRLDIGFQPIEHFSRTGDVNENV